jgi:hypothetical protein
MNAATDVAKSGYCPNRQEPVVGSLVHNARTALLPASIDTMPFGHGGNIGDRCSRCEVMTKRADVLNIPPDPASVEGDEDCDNGEKNSNDFQVRTLVMANARSEAASAATPRV